MTDPRVHFVFWGSYWLTPDGVEKADTLVHAFTRATPTYFSGLAQYGVGTPKLVGMTVVAPPKLLTTLITQLPGIGVKSPLEPPAMVTEAAVVAMLDAQMQAGVLRPAHEVARSTYFLVIVPPGSATTLANLTRPGLHTFWWLPRIQNYVWWGLVAAGNISTDITIMFHELVEGMSDPQGGGVQGPPNYISWVEIVDICCGRTSAFGDLLLPAYWSEHDKACIVPQPKILRAEGAAQLATGAAR